MARTGSKSSTFDCTPEQLLEVIIDPAFQAEQRELDEAVVEAKTEIISKDDKRCVFEIRAKEYDRGVTGLDKSKTIESVTKVDWDLVAMSSRWTYESTSPHASRFTVSGGNKIRKDGERAILDGDNSVEVRIPLLGGQIEKVVLDGLLKGRDGYDTLLKQYLAKRKG